MAHFRMNLGDFTISLITNQISDSQYLLGLGTFSGQLLVADMSIKELEQNDSENISSI